MQSSIRIDQLHLRLSGVNREHARHLGQEVAQSLAKQLSPSMRSRNLAMLRVQLTIPSGTLRDRLGSVIAAGIMKQIL